MLIISVFSANTENIWVYSYHHHNWFAQTDAISSSEILISKWTEELNGAYHKNTSKTSKTNDTRAIEMLWLFPGIILLGSPLKKLVGSSFTLIFWFVYKYERKLIDLPSWHAVMDIFIVPWCPHCHPNGARISQYSSSLKPNSTTARFEGLSI